MFVVLVVGIDEDDDEEQVVAIVDGSRDAVMVTIRSKIASRSRSRSRQQKEKVDVDRDNGTDDVDDDDTECTNDAIGHVNVMEESVYLGITLASVISYCMQINLNLLLKTLSSAFVCKFKEKLRCISQPK